VEIIFQIGLALDHVHRNGLIHFDVKPANIMVSVDDKCKRIDFGIAEVPDAPIRDKCRLSTGTTTFMSPELSEQGVCSVKCDVWSFGVTLLLLIARCDSHIHSFALCIVSTFPQSLDTRKSSFAYAAECCASTLIIVSRFQRSLIS
jgi:serine/threonine protein kinase